MAIYGRRQPHAPIILRGGQFQPPVGRSLVIQKQAGLASRRPSSRVRVYAPPVIGAVATTQVGAFVIVGQKTSQHAANRAFRRSFQPQTKRAGGQPSFNRLLAVQKISQLAARRPVTSTRVIFPTVRPGVAVAPVGHSLSLSRIAVQAAIAARLRPSHGFVHPSPVRPLPPPTPGVTLFPPLLSRGDRSLTERLRRDHEILTSIINSLLMSGQLIQTSPGVWKIVLLP